MVNYACAFSQSESGKYFEWILISNNCLPQLIARFLCKKYGNNDCPINCNCAHPSSYHPPRTSFFFQFLSDDIIKIKVLKVWLFVGIFWKNNIWKAYLPKTSIVGQVVAEILVPFCSDDSIQIILNLTWFLMLWSESNFVGFVWSHQCISDNWAILKATCPGMLIFGK